MELPKLFSKLKTQEAPKETFLAVEIDPATVKSAVWAVDGKKTVVLKMGSVEEWEEDKEDSLITAVDNSITNASEGIEPEPNKVILGLINTWVNDNDISESKKALLKIVCSKLELKPLGFVVNLEAMVTYLKEEEGTPISAIFINLSESQALVSLVQLGKVKGTHSVGRSEDLAADVREGLARFGEVENLPSRMILFDGLADFEDAKQQLMSFDWQKHLPFLHFPKVESLEVAASIKAVAIAGGAEVAKSLGFSIEEYEIAEDKTSANEITDSQISGTETLELKEENDQVLESKDVAEELTAQDFGFVLDKDIAHLKKPTIKSTESINREEVLKPTTPNIKETIPAPNNPVKKPQRLSFRFFNISNAVTSLKNFLTGFFGFFKQQKISFVFIPIIFLLVIALAGFLFYWYVPKATITIYVKPQVLEKEFSVTFDTAAAGIDKEKIIIPASLKELEIDGKKTKAVTGEKLIGEKATGEVTIYNKTDVTKTFSKGTVLIGPDKLTFVLDSEIKVASRSSQKNESGEQVTYGKANVDISAQSIGTESNLGSSSELTIKDYPSSVYSAKTEKGLSGGISRQVKAVGKEDLSVLLEELSSELSSQAQEQIQTGLNSGEAVLNKEAESVVVNKKYSAGEDEEADTLGLDLKVKFTFLIYKKDDLYQLFMSKLAGDVTSGLNFDKDTTAIEVKDIELTDKKAKTLVKINTTLIPNINTDEIKSSIKGKYPQIIQSYLESLPEFVRADIKIYPTLPAKLNTLPRQIKNIKVDIRTE